MKIIETPIDDLLVIELDVFGDARGFFVERFNKTKLEEAGFPTTDFPQDNHSRSAPGVLRGLHYQHTLPQGKLVGVANGRIWDVAVDVRPGSDTFGQHYGVELSDENGRMLWMPAGFAHGFCVLGKHPADVLYKVTNIYNPNGEGGIKWDDSDLKVAWPLENMDVAGEPTVSKRDQNLTSFAEYKKNPPGWS